MSEYLEIPLTAGRQVFTITLGGKRYKITLNYRHDVYGGSWYIDFMRTDESEGILGVTLDCGYNLFQQYKTKHFGSLVCRRLDGSNKRPDYEDMGKNISLLWSDS